METSEGEIKMEKGLVSIITPCYNGAKYIGETIESVKGQTYENWEMIIVDDGSNDESVSIISRYVENEPRIKMIRQENKGSAAARNNGIRQAKGQYIALLDADDIWKENFLREQITLMLNKKTQCVYSSYECIDENSKPLHKYVYAKSVLRPSNMRVRNYIGCLTGVYDISTCGKIYLHEDLGSVRDDYAYWYDVLMKTGIAYGNKHVIAQYRILANSTTGNKRKLIKKQYMFYRNYLNESIIESIKNLFIWGIVGLKKYYI